MSLETAKRVLRIEARAIEEVMARLDGAFERAVDLLLNCKGRVVVTGMGKSGLVARKISATLSSTGTPSFFLHPADAVLAKRNCAPQDLLERVKTMSARKRGPRKGSVRMAAEDELAKAS